MAFSMTTVSIGFSTLVTCLSHLFIFSSSLTSHTACPSVFDVDIGDGEPIRKLPYNRSGMLLLRILVTFAHQNMLVLWVWGNHNVVYYWVYSPYFFFVVVLLFWYFLFLDVVNTCILTENPYDVADKWLLNENLPLSYRQQIVEFILQNTGQKDFTPDPLFRDPYTGCKA